MFFYFLYKIEEDNVCYAISGSNIGSPFDLTGDAIEVSANFRILLLLYAILYCIELGRLLFTVMSERMGMGGCGVFANILRLNGIAMLAAWIMMMVFRLRHAGRVCSGVYVKNIDDPLNQFYLITRGRLFFALILITWILLGLAILGAILACICGGFKR